MIFSFNQSDHSHSAIHQQIVLFPVEHAKNMRMKRCLLLLCLSKSDSFVIQPNHVLSSALFYDPFDFESVEAKSKRMETVRELQQSFYANETAILPPLHGVFSSLPIWTDSYTELPGFQRVMNVADPELVNMVLKIVSAKQPWYFGHLFNNPRDSNHQIILDDDGPVIGTLMQISDYELEEDDGMLRIGVQALGRFCIVSSEGDAFNKVSSGRAVAASVELLPDLEIVEAHYNEAEEAANSFDFALNQNALGAACAGAIAEAADWRDYEFEPIALGEQVDEVAKLNPTERVTATNDGVHAAMEEYLSQPPSDMYEGECILAFDVERNERRELSMDQTFKLEQNVWIQLDRLTKLLRLLDPKCNTNMPIPQQLLELLPASTPMPWPNNFSLSRYNQKMKNIHFLLKQKKSKLKIGATNLNTMETASDYPSLRRSRRLSYMVWELVERLLDGEYSYLLTEERMIPTKQDILEMTSIYNRLYAAIKMLEEIIFHLQKLIE